MGDNLILLEVADEMTAHVIFDILTANNIDYTFNEEFGAGLTTRTSMSERYNIFVAKDDIPKARKLLVHKKDND